MKLLIRSLILLVLIYALNTDHINSQIKVSVNDSVVNSLNKGSWTIIFEVGTFIDTRTFEGFQFCGKYHISRHSALRLGFTYMSSSDVGTVNYDKTNNNIEFPSDSKNSDFKALPAYLFYINPVSSLVLFFGGGPIYSYSYDKSNWNYYFDLPYGDYEAHNEERVTKTWSAGIHAVLGAEWFITHRISLVGEYNASATSGKSKTTLKQLIVSSFYPAQTITGEGKSNFFKLSFNIVKLGVSVYF